MGCYSAPMPDTATDQSRCPVCDAEYKVVRAEAPLIADKPVAAAVSKYTIRTHTIHAIRYDLCIRGEVLGYKITIIEFRQRTSEGGDLVRHADLLGLHLECSDILPNLRGHSAGPMPALGLKSGGEDLSRSMSGLLLAADMTNV